MAAQALGDVGVGRGRVQTRQCLGPSAASIAKLQRLPNQRTKVLAPEGMDAGIGISGLGSAVAIGAAVRSMARRAAAAVVEVRTENVGARRCDLRHCETCHGEDREQNKERFLHIDKTS